MLVSEEELSVALEQLSPVASVIQRLLVVLKDPNSDVTDIACLVKADTTLSASVLKLANSAHFGLSERVGAVDAAIQHIGVNEVYRIVAALSGQQLLQRPLDRLGISASLLWQHTLAVAVSAEILAASQSIDADTSYIAGILHPVGLVALDVVAEARNLGERPKHIVLRDWETDQFGVGNHDAAARILRYWHFPDALADAVGGRYREPTPETVHTVASILYLASCIAERLPAGLPPEAGSFRVSPLLLELFRLTPGDFSDIELNCRQKISRMRALLKLA